MELTHALPGLIKSQRTVTLYLVCSLLTVWLLWSESPCPAKVSISCPRRTSSNTAQGLASAPHHFQLRSRCPTFHILTLASTFPPSNASGCLFDDWSFLVWLPATMSDWLAVPLCPVPAVYSGICTAPPRTGGRHVNIPARPRLSMTMWVNWTNPLHAACEERAQIYVYTCTQTLGCSCATLAFRLRLWSVKETEPDVWLWSSALTLQGLRRSSLKCLKSNGDCGGALLRSAVTTAHQLFKSPTERPQNCLAGVKGRAGSRLYIGGLEASAKGQKA